MDNEFAGLFTPFQIGKLRVKNRLVMGPMGFSHIMGPKGEFTPQSIEYLAERAHGGWGLMYLGVQTTDRVVDSYPGIKTPLDDPYLYKRTASVLLERLAAYDVRVIPQLSLGYGRNAGGKTPSPVPDYHAPSSLTNALTKDEIKVKEEQLVKAAELQREAGFDGVELHALHWGYLLDEFAMSVTNHREDEYGGSLDNRLRVVRELVDGIHDVCGEDFPVTMRLGLKSYMRDWNEATLDGSEEIGRTIEEGIEIAKRLEAMGIAALSVDTGTYDSFYYSCPPSYMPKGYALDLYARCKEAVGIPVLAGSRMNDPKLCARALAEGKADAFVMSRQSLADPEFPNKVMAGEAERVRPCIGCNVGCIGHTIDWGLPTTCAVNPRAMRETEVRIEPAVTKKRVIVVGGGCAGMEAARVARLRGHEVTLLEASDRLGGELKAGGRSPFKAEVAQYDAWCQGELSRLGVDVRLNVRADAQTVLATHPDAVILAVGASPVRPRSIEGINHPHAKTVVDILEGKEQVEGPVVVIGGGEVGCEAAVAFAQRGMEVTLVEGQHELMKASPVPNQHRSMLSDMLVSAGVRVLTATYLRRIDDQGATVAPAAGGDEELIPARTVALSIGMRPNPSFASELVGSGVEVYSIGSGRRPSNVYSAVHDAYEVATHI